MELPLFIEAGWLKEHLSDPALRIIDARSIPYGRTGPDLVPGRERYTAGHLPGAIHLDYGEELKDPSTPHAARVAPPERFAEMMSANGIGDGHTIIAYDDATVPYAARIVWMCRYYGHDDVHILAGGLPAWVAAGGALSREVPHFAPATFTPRTRPQLRASLDEVVAIAGGRSAAQLVETQRNSSYAERDRDIPNACRISGDDLLEDARGGRIAPVEKLKQLAAERGLDPHKRTVVSCGSGVSAAGAYLALSEAGFTDLAVYDGSWLEWKHEGLPTVEKADAGR
jgi:thiosulfate/3-mercaptopyruvate sulfurtransferase